MLESKGLKVNISKTKVMRCARDGVQKEAAVNPCRVYGNRVGVKSIHCVMSLLGTQAMFGSVRKFGKSGTGLFVQSV